MYHFGYTTLAAIALLGVSPMARVAVACDCEKKAPVRPVAATRSQATGVLRSWQGTQSGMAEAGQRVVRSQAEWEQLWARMSANQVPPQPSPKVDWSKEMVVAYFMGERPTGGFSAAIKSVIYGQKEIVVAYQETAPPPDAVTIQVLTHPYVVAVVKRSSLPVRFTPAGSATLRPGT
jgi:hypothetical protein